MPQPGERPSANCSVSLDLSSLIPKQKTACSHGTAAASWQQPSTSSEWSLAGLLQALLPRVEPKCLHACVCAQSLSRVQPCVTPWTVAHQAPLSVGILQARIVEWVAIPPSGDLPDPGIEPKSPALQEDSMSEPPGNPGSGRFPGEGNGNPPQYPCLEREQ